MLPVEGLHAHLDSFDTELGIRLSDPVQDLRLLESECLKPARMVHLDDDGCTLYVLHTAVRRKGIPGDLLPPLEEGVITHPPFKIGFSEKRS